MKINEELKQLEDQGLLRTLTTAAATGGKWRSEGREWLNFSSNDYLDLVNDPRLKQAACEATQRWGCGATASRLMSGHLALHEQLETQLARMCGQPRGLVFGSGFLTNLGVLGALVGRDGAIFSDKLNHASLVDGSLLSRARRFRYRHRDIGHLETLLARNPVRGRRLIVSDSVFSMDGDLAPLVDLRRVADEAGTLLIIDEAHAIGILGKLGGGACREPGIEISPDVTIGTLSKSLGGYGGFAVCSAEMRELLINRARGFIYSTALPPACLGSALRALEIVEQEPQLGRRLLDRARRMRALLGEGGFELPTDPSQILPVRVGEAKTALAWSHRLHERGLLAVAVRPPTVPKGTARLRLSVTLAHEEPDLARAADVIVETGREAGLL